MNSWYLTIIKLWGQNARNKKNILKFIILDINKLEGFDKIRHKKLFVLLSKLDLFSKICRITHLNRSHTGKKAPAYGWKMNSVCAPEEKRVVKHLFSSDLFAIDSETIPREIECLFKIYFRWKQPYPHMICR